MNGIKISRSKSFIAGTLFFVFFASMIFVTANTWAKKDNNPKELLARIEALEAMVADLEDKLANVRVDGNTVWFEGVNVQIVSGTGVTGPDINGLGNLIVGYNEDRESEEGDNIRDGSHNIVVGEKNNYSSWGGLVLGYMNEINGVFSSITGGIGNIANGNYSNISTGIGNTTEAEALYSNISTGIGNTASGSYSSISTGIGNTASGNYSNISTGIGNTTEAEALYSNISTGIENTTEAEALYSNISTGIENTASGSYSSISTGIENTASGNYSNISTGIGNTTEAEALYSNISTGIGNTTEAEALYSNISTGIENTASGIYDSVVGDAGKVYVHSTLTH